MALDRWIALIILGIALAYGYAAFFTMDQLLPPFMQRNPIWPSTFPKVLAVLSIITAAIIVLGLEKPSGEVKTPDIDYRRLGDYNIGQAALLLGLMVAYALLLRPGALLGGAGVAGAGLTRPMDTRCQRGGVCEGGDPSVASGVLCLGKCASAIVGAREGGREGGKSCEGSK